MKSLYYNNKKEMPFSPCKECDINSLCSNLRKGAGTNDKFKPTEKLKGRRF